MEFVTTSLLIEDYYQIVSWIQNFFMLKVCFGLQILSILQQWSTILLDKIVGALYTLCIASISYNSSNSYATSSRWKLAHSCCSYEILTMHTMYTSDDENVRQGKSMSIFQASMLTNYCSIVNTSHLWILHFHLLSITSCTSINIMTMSSSTFFTL
jgi:hypothetical protein